MSVEGMRRVRVFVEANLWWRVEGACRNPKVVAECDGVVVVEADNFDPSGVPRSLQYERLMDWNWLIFAAANFDARVRAEGAFFDFIAPIYEELIEVERNDNCRRLLVAAVAFPEARILDFGCGPGGLADVGIKVRLVGCDASESMRQEARRRGLNVLGPDELPIGTPSFDGVIAAYVLHLALRPEDLIRAAETVAGGGRFAANFHKGRGVDDVSDLLCRDGRMSLADELHHELHGVIRVWEKAE